MPTYLNIKYMLIYGKNVILQAIQSKKQLQKVLFSENVHFSGTLSKILQLVKQNKIPFGKIPRKHLDKITNFSPHQGVVGYLSDYQYYDIEEILSNKAHNLFLLILDEVQDPHNLGAILRIAETANLNGVIIPQRRSAKVNEVVFKISAGAASEVRVCCVVNIANTLSILREKNILVIGLDQRGENIYQANIAEGNIALVVGGEDKGLTEYIKSKCDTLVKIPLRGKITSLNTSCAVAVAVWEILRKKSLLF